MGCRSDHMNPNDREKESVNVLTLLKEVGLYNAEIPYYGHPEELDNQTSTLCKFCQGNDVRKYSLELQMWWRDHKIADEKRLKEEFEESRKAIDTKVAIEKLTPYERELLGL